MMGRYQLRFVVCTLYIILQCNMSIQAQIKAFNNCDTVEIRIPISSINNKNSAPQNRQYGPSYPYPYYTQLSQYYANICNSCKGFLCNSKCSNSNPIKLNSISNSLSLSVPSNSNSGRLTFIIDSRSQAKPDATTPAPNNGENNIDVIVKVVPIDPHSTSGTAYTSARSSAKQYKNGNQITAFTTAQELDSKSTKGYEISVYVKDVNARTSPLNTSLQGQIIAENADGDVLVSKTNSDIVETAILATDGDDTTVTGDTSPNEPVIPPPDEQQAQPVIPESDAPLAKAPTPDTPPPGSPPAPAPQPDSPPAPAPKPDSPPAPAPKPDSPPAEAPKPDSPPAEAPPEDSTATVASETTATAATVTD